MRLLLVDDDERFRALLRATCEAVEVDVEEAGSARDADLCITARRPDVIVLDVALPGLDGLTYCRRLKEEAATSEIGVVLLTGMFSTNDLSILILSTGRPRRNVSDE